MTEPGFVPFPAVECGRLNIFVFSTVIFGNDAECTAISHLQGDFIEKGTADVIGGATRCDRVKAHLGEDHKGRHTSAVFVTRHTHQVVPEPLRHELTDAFLSFPGLPCVVIEIGNMQRGLVGHRKLTYVAGMVGELCVEIELALTQRLAEGLIEMLYELFTATHQMNQVGHIVRHIPAVDPGVVLTIILTRPHASGELIIERGDETALLVFRMEEARFGVEEMAVVI